MSALLDAVQAARAALDNARTQLDAARSAVTAQERKAKSLRDAATAMRGDILSARIDADCGATVHNSPTAAELQDAELDAESAEAAIERLRARIEPASAAVTEADEALKDAIDDFLREEVEGPAVLEIRAAFDRIVATSARAIAAGKIAKDHDRMWGFYSPSTSTCYGDTGRLINQIRGIDWHRLPERIRVPALARQYVDENPTSLRGVDEAVAELSALIGSSR